MENNSGAGIFLELALPVVLCAHGDLCSIYKQRLLTKRDLPGSYDTDQVYCYIQVLHSKFPASWVSNYLNKFQELVRTLKNAKPPFGALLEPCFSHCLIFYISQQIEAHTQNTHGLTGIVCEMPKSGKIEYQNRDP